MKKFYQINYTQEGLTTDLPNNSFLSELLENSFRGSGKDFSADIEIIQALGVKPGMRVLDFGANWGYTTRQFINNGYDCIGFEISAPRAMFGEKLGVSIKTELSEVGGDFDVVYSSHVLEHVPNPLQTLSEQMSRTRSGGFVIGFTPNGSASRQVIDQRSFRSHWGQVHPVLLSDGFIAFCAGSRPCLVGAQDYLEMVLTWDKQDSSFGKMTGDNLFFAIKC